MYLWKALAIVIIEAVLYTEGSNGKKFEVNLVLTLVDKWDPYLLFIVSYFITLEFRVYQRP